MLASVTSPCTVLCPERGQKTNSLVTFELDMPGPLYALSIIPILIYCYALFAALRTESYTRIQVQLMQDQAKKSEEQERDERQWDERQETLATRLSNISPNMMLAASDAKSHFCLYPAVFQDSQFRNKLETYVVKQPLMSCACRGCETQRQLLSS